jgi:hypothetical protein
MLREFSSMEIARRAFDEYARVEPRLTGLWYVCRRAAPPVPANDVDDAFDVDPFEADGIVSDSPDDGWCAEDYFFENVKPELLRLIGWYRLEEPPELRQSRAYDAVYSALFYHALHRPCACCRERGEGRHPDGGSPPMLGA